MKTGIRYFSTKTNSSSTTSSNSDGYVINIDGVSIPLSPNSNFLNVPSLHSVLTRDTNALLRITDTPDQIMALKWMIQKFQIGQDSKC